MSRYAAGVFALLCCTALFVGGIAATDGSYDISVDGSVDTPDRVVTLEGNDYTVSAIGVVAPGEPIEVAVDAPADATYDLYLYNDDRQSEARINDASATETFDGDYPAGSYMVAVYADGNFVTVHPVVVSSYDVTLDAPQAAAPGDTVEFTVDLENVAGTEENLDSVQVVVSNDGEYETISATEAGDGSYTATTTLSETGEYLVYGNVRGEETAEGQKELLGVSQSTTVSVEESTPTPTSTATGGSGNDPTDEGTATVTATATSTGTATATATDTTTPASATASAAPATETATSTATPSNVVTPNEESSTTETTGRLSVLIPVLALLGFGLVTRRR